MPDKAPSGGATVAEPPASGTPNAPLDGSIADTDPNASILDFAPPDTGDVMDAIKGISTKEPLAGTKPKGEGKKKPDESQPTNDPTPSKKPDGQQKKADEPPANLLRKELETTKTNLTALTKERDELKTRLDAGDPRVKELTAQIESEKKERESIKTKLDEYEREKITQNAENHPDVKAILSEFNREADRFYRRGVKTDHGTMMKLAADMTKLPFGKPEYADARAEFEKTVNLALGGTDEQPHRHLDAAMEFLDKANEFGDRHARKLAEVREQNDEYVFGQGDAQYKTFRKQVDDKIAEAKTVPDDADERHPRWAVNKFMEQLGDKSGDIDKGIEEFARLVMVGMPPRSKKELAALSPQQIAEMQQRDLKIVNEARAVAPEILFNGTRALRLFPILIKELSRLRAKVGEDVDANPPDPTRQKADETPKDDDDLTQLKPPSLDDLDFA